MKYMVVLYDGMADYPVEALNGKTPMMVANKPNFDGLAQKGEIGLVNTIPSGMKPGSDVANLSVLGYDPKTCYTGRSPLEASSIGVSLSDTDVTLRCNLVTLSEEENFEDKIMIDYSAGDISSFEAAEIIKTIEQHFGNNVFRFYPGVSYRHCLVWHNGTIDLGNLTPPHDISGKRIGSYLSENENAKTLLDMMKKSTDILKNHPINDDRKAKGKRPANSIWLWGEGTKPSLSYFYERTGLKGSIISAVDLLRGIGGCARMNTPIVEGVTGYIDTNFEGKANAAIAEFENGQDFVYLHIEAPDECGHRNEPENKVRSIELIDQRVLPILIKGLNKYDDYKIMILPDHPTPIVTGTHASDPVPYMIYHKSKEKTNEFNSIDEQTAANSGVYIDSGVALMEHFIKDD